MLRPRAALRWGGLSYAPHTVEVLTLFFMCKLSLSKAFRRTWRDTDTLQRPGPWGVRPPLEWGGGAGALQKH